MQIHDGTNWLALPCYDAPENLDGEVEVQAVYDIGVPGFFAAWKAWLNATGALFRANDADAGRRFYVRLEDAPTLAPGRVMTSMITLIPATEVAA